MHIPSIIIYLSTFLLSFCFLRISNEILYDKSEKYKEYYIWGILLCVFALLMPCLLAASRSMNVGTDIKTYIIPNIGISKAALSKGFLDYYEWMPVSTEIGFAYILYIGLYFDNIGISFFLMQILTITPVYWALVKYREHVSVSLGMLIYYFLCYNFSLSGMRVSISMSILLLMSYYLYVGQKKKVIIISFIALLFHLSTIIMVLLFLIILFFFRSANQTKVYLSLCILFLILFSNNIYETALNLMSFVNPRYVYYIEEYYTSDIKTEDVPATDFLCKCIMIIIISWFLVINKKMDSQSKYFLIMCVVGRFFVLTNSIIYESMRIAYYFDMFIVLYAASINNSKIKNKLKRDFATILIIIPSFFYWLYFIMAIGGYETNVFTFR